MPTYALDPKSIASLTLAFAWPYQLSETPAGATGSRLMFDKPLNYPQSLFDFLIQHKTLDHPHSATFSAIFAGHYLPTLHATNAVTQFEVITNFAHRLATNTYDLSPDFADVISKTLGRLL
jgi:hypothetical protein